MRGARRGGVLLVVLLLAVVLRPKSGSIAVPLPPAAKPSDSASAIPLPAPITPPAPPAPRDTATPPAVLVRVTTPAHGGAQRTALLDAVRRQLNTSSRFRVDHVRVAGRWAFLRATEVVPLERGELQETDLTVAALLELPAGSTSWHVTDYWTLPGENARPLAGFKRRVAERLRVEGISPVLLPGDL